MKFVVKHQSTAFLSDSTHNFLSSPHLIYMLTTAHPMQSWKIIIPSHNPLWIVLIGAAPVKGIVASLELLPGAELPRARPKQLAILKKISIFP